MKNLEQKILAEIYQIRNLSKPLDLEDAFLSRLSDKRQIERIQEFIKKSEPIHLILPAFPAKSPNAQKTLLKTPDLAEVLALQKLNELCLRIQSLYSPGARLTICSDGRVFNDLVGVSDSAVDSYGREIQEIISKYALSNLDTYNLDDVFPTFSHQKMRSILMDEYANSLESLKDKIKSEPESLNLFNGIHRFMFEDQLVLKPDFSRNKVRNLAKDLAYQVILRSNAWSSLLEEKFPNSLRLSIHPQPAYSMKIGIQLLPSQDIWRTPWHSVAVFDGQGYYLLPKKEVEELGGVLDWDKNGYAYYKLPKVA